MPPCLVARNRIGLVELRRGMMGKIGILSFKVKRNVSNLFHSHWNAAFHRRSSRVPVLSIYK